MARALEHGMLYIEKYQGHEKNTLIYNLIDMHVSGFEPDSIREYAAREIKYRLMHYETLWEMLFVGFRGLRDGDNPRSLGTYLLSFIEEGEQESVLELK
jgi:flagellar motor component MotA